MLDLLSNNPVVLLAALQAGAAFLLVASFIGILKLTGRVA